MRPPGCTSLAETQRLGTPQRHPLAGGLLATFFTRERSEEGKRKGWGSSTQQPYALLHPCQVYRCQSQHKTAPAQVSHSGQCLTLTLSQAALEETSHQPWTIFQAEPPYGLGQGGLHLTQRHVPSGCRCPRLLAMRYKAQLRSSLGMAENVFRREQSTGAGLRAVLRHAGVFGNAS